MKMRSDCVLNSLTETERNEIYDAIASGEGYREIQKPDGYNVKIQLATLCRFYKSERRRRHAEELAQSKFDDLAAGDRDQLLENVRLELAHACYDLAHNTDASSVNILARITHRLDVIQLEQQRIALERAHLAEKVREFNYNAARVAAKYAAQIHKVIETKGPDAEDKTWMVSNIVFGPSPAHSSQGNGNYLPP